MCPILYPVDVELSERFYLYPSEFDCQRVARSPVSGTVEVRAFAELPLLPFSLLLVTFLVSFACLLDLSHHLSSTSEVFLVRSFLFYLSALFHSLPLSSSLFLSLTLSFSLFLSLTLHYTLLSVASHLRGCALRDSRRGGRDAAIKPG